MNEIIIPFLLPAGLFLGLMIGWLDRREMRKANRLSDALLKHCKKDLRDTENKHHELLWGVESKCPGETRHETALRYISEAERRGTSEAKREKVQNTQLEGDRNV